MMKSLSKHIEYVGFDMDGTLYDEYEFISEVYKEIAKEFKSQDAHVFMCNRWIEKGSSYNKIFDETYDMFELNGSASKDKFIDKALAIFRDFKPNISLSKRVKHLLKFYKKHYEIFLVSDGNETLQKNKFLSLGLDDYFKKENVIFTGVYSSEYHKPSAKVIQFLDIDVDKTLFFGDRDIDEGFAKSAKIEFIKVYNMVKI